ncbi:MAG TPA: nucleoside diphosphate kinase regulator [Lysobacter sp.]|nr:nucleoside diphosphate kinase regulator [Lysobacter sp.]
MNSQTTPRLTISVRDARRLEALIANPAFADNETAELLAEELARAELLEPQDMPADVVTMNSSVTVLDETTGAERTVRVVYPNETGAVDCVSVLAPVGAALLGLRAGDAIDWPMPGDRTARLRVTRVLYQPEAAGLPE